MAHFGRHCEGGRIHRFYQCHNVLDLLIQSAPIAMRCERQADPQT